MNQSTLNQLTTSLKDYSPTAYKIMGDISHSMQHVAVILLLLFMGLEMFNWYQHLKNNGGELTLQLFFELAIKYVLAYFLVLSIDQIFDIFGWMFNGMIKLAAKNGVSPYKVKIPDFKGLNFVAKGILQTVYWVIDFIGQIATKLLILLRSSTLYVYKGIAKIVVACFMMDALRPICFNFFKLYLAAILQGVILVIIILLYPAIVTDDLLKVATTGAWTSALTAIAKGIIYILLLFGSQRMAKSILQVN